MKRVIKAAETIDLQSIDLQPVYDHISDLLKANVKIEKEEIKTMRSGTEYIYFESENIANRCGVLSQYLREVRLATFNSQPTDYGYWMTVHFSYETLDGGSNGFDCFSAQYENGKWSFRDK